MGVKKHSPKTDEQKRTDESPEKESSSLKGTFFFVMALGVFIILSWATIYTIFITR